MKSGNELEYFVTLSPVERWHYILANHTVELLLTVGFIAFIAWKLL